MEAQSVLVLAPHAAAGAAVARAMSRLYPSLVVAVADPATALSRLSSGTIDVVVPLGLPRHGSNALLDWVRRSSPPGVQIVTTIDQPNPPASPPAAAAERIARALLLRGGRANPELVSHAINLSRVPVIAAVYEDVCYRLALHLVAPGGGGLEDVAQLIGQDPGMAVRLLRLVSSAAVDERGAVASIPHAVSLVGTARLASLMLGIDPGDQIRTSGDAGHTIETDWHRAMLTAQLSRKIAAHEGLSGDELESVYVAGLLHNVARLMLAAGFSEEFAGIDWPRSLPERIRVERARFGFGHPELGSVLAGLWGLDDVVAEAIGFYVRPGAAASKSFGALAAVHAATVLLDDGLEWDRGFLVEVGLNDRIDDWSQLDDVRRLVGT